MHNRTNRSRVRPTAAICGMVVAAVLIASCSSSSSSGTTTTTSTAPTTSTTSSSSTTAGGSSAPGVSATAIKIGTIATETGSLASNFDAFTPGMQAYFDMVNANGGINGRKLNIAYSLDDGGSPTTFNQLAHTLLQQDQVFAVGVSTYWFTPNLFVQTKTPTYGYDVSGNWSGQPNLYAAGGSVQDYDLGAGAVSYLINKTKSKSVAIISYGSAITSSYNACHADATNLAAAGINVSYVNLDESLGGSYTSAVQQMQQHGADFVLTCMQASDNITLARALQQYGLKVTQLWFDGYDNSLLDQYSSLMQGVYLNANTSVPFTATTKFPGTYPGVQKYLTEMAKYEPKFIFSQEALQGWESGALLAQGITNAGSNVTQQNVINQDNLLTNFTAGGVSSTVNWVVGHTGVTYPNCSSFIQVKGKKFVPVLAKTPQVFLCFPKGVNLKNPTLATPPVGTPGA
jgi:branched-chain amino acid transport system substrate-binding protein